MDLFVFGASNYPETATMMSVPLFGRLWHYVRKVVTGTLEEHVQLTGSV